MKRALVKMLALAAMALFAAAPGGLSVYAMDSTVDHAFDDYVVSDRVNFREGAGMDAAVLEILNEGTAVRAAIGDPDGWSAVQYGDRAGFIKTEFLMTQAQYEALPKAKLELIEWRDAKSVVRIGADLKILDVWSGATYYVRSFSNGSHADVEPITKEDTATLKRTYGGVWDWDPRPVWVFTDGRVLAASINGMPHGGGVNDSNGMNGQVCLHFKGSTTHNGNSRFAREHQNAVMQAWYAK